MKAALYWNIFALVLQGVIWSALAFDFVLSRHDRRWGK